MRNEFVHHNFHLLSKEKTSKVTYAKKLVAGHPYLAIGSGLPYHSVIINDERFVLNFINIVAKFLDAIFVATDKTIAVNKRVTE